MALDKMNGKFFKYTLILLGVAIIFIIIGGISVSRVDDYAQYEETIEVSLQTYNDLTDANEKLRNERQMIVDILHENITDEEKIDKIEEIFFGTEN